MENKSQVYWPGCNVCTVHQGAPDEWRDEETRPRVGLPHATVEAGVVATAAFLVSGRRL